MSINLQAGSADKAVEIDASLSPCTWQSQPGDTCVVWLRLAFWQPSLGGPPPRKSSAAQEKTVSGVFSHCTSANGVCANFDGSIKQQARAVTVKRVPKGCTRIELSLQIFQI